MTWLLIAICWAVSFVFSGIEAGLLALSPVRLRHQARSGDRAAQRLAKMLENPERLLVSVLLATNAADIVALILVTHSLVRRFGINGYAISLAVALPVYLFLLGVLPKSLFRRFPLRAVARFTWLLELAEKIFWPVLEIGQRLTRLVFSRRPAPPRLFAAREELKMITLQSERAGALSATERAIIHNVVDFTSVKVRQVMVPLERTIFLRPDETPQRALELSAANGIDRYPILGDDGKATGIINVFDILFDTAPRGSLRAYARRVINTSEDESVSRLVRRLRAARTGLAVVVEAGQKMHGVVTLEDLVRQLVRS